MLVLEDLQALLDETGLASATGSYFEQENASSSSSTGIVSNRVTESAASNKTTVINDSGVDRKRKIFFVHVGKTGGTTLRETVLRYGCRLYGQAKARNRCLNFLAEHGESQLAKRTTGLFHYEMRIPTSKKQRDNMDLLYVVREPISRFQSSYEYINPHNCILDRKERAMQKKCDSQKRAQNFPNSFDSQFYYECFPTIESFLSYVPPPLEDGSSSKNNNTNPDKCRPLWLQAFRPGQSEYGHMSANYQYYTKDMGLMSRENGRRVYVIRTEHLWDDVSHIDQLVGGTGNFSFVARKKINKQTTVKHVGPGIQYVPHTFCCALLPDMLVFRDIINRADNFDEPTKLATNEHSWSRCNVTSWEMLETRCNSSE
eukprot:scaffold747_cov120-Cylindrotheca_fusiformis.AAC.23